LARNLFFERGKGKELRKTGREDKISLKTKKKGVLRRCCYKKLFFQAASKESLKRTIRWPLKHHAKMAMKRKVPFQNDSIGRITQTDIRQGERNAAKQGTTRGSTYPSFDAEGDQI